MLQTLVPNGSDSDRGQVGIGTLIVFIAMVLVAAIAAGVLINTAGFLQSSAEETGQQSSDQVTNRLEVVSAVGTQINDNGGGDTVDLVELTVRKAPGAGNIDLGETTLQMVHTSGAYDIIYDGNKDDDGDADNDDFNVTRIQDDDSSISNSQVLNDPADRATIYINADTVISGNTDPASSSGNGLSEGSTATVRINTQSGGTTELRLVVPETLSADSAVTL